MLVLNQSEIDLFENSKNNFEKRSLKQLQKIYLKYNQGDSYCMCNLIKRKVKYREFYNWYDKTRN
jgi:hypothetical protein